MQCVFLYLLPFSVYEVWMTPRWQRRTWLERETVWATLLAGIGWGGTVACYIMSLMFTSTVRGSLLSSLTPLVLLIHYRVSGQRISRNEIWGALLATLGMAVCFLSSSDPERSDTFGLGAPATAAGSLDAGAVATGTSGHPTTLLPGHALLGDFLATAASVFTAMDVEYSVRARQTVPIFTFSTACCFVAVVLATVCAVLVEGATWSVSITGLFGWWLPEYRVPMLLFAFAIGFLAILGFNHSVKYVPPLVFSIIILLDPVLTGFFSFEIGLEALPSFWTVVGGAIVLGGIAVVVTNESPERAH